MQDAGHYLISKCVTWDMPLLVRRCLRLVGCRHRRPRQHPRCLPDAAGVQFQPCSHSRKWQCSSQGGQRLEVAVSCVCECLAHCTSHIWARSLGMQSQLVELNMICHEPCKEPPTSTLICVGRVDLGQLGCQCAHSCVPLSTISDPRA